MKLNRFAKLGLVSAVFLLGFLLTRVPFKQEPVSSYELTYKSNADSDQKIREAFESKQSDLWVESEGTVVKILKDDNAGSRHQRFILRLSNGQTILIAHNIDLAPRIEDLELGSTVTFFGEYEWNPQGGVVHWTHHDPRAQKPGGWLEYKGKRYS